MNKNKLIKESLVNLLQIGDVIKSNCTEVIGSYFPSVFTDYYNKWVVVEIFKSQIIIKSGTDVSRNGVLYCISKEKIQINDNELFIDNSHIDYYYGSL